MNLNILRLAIDSKGSEDEITRMENLGRSESQFESNNLQLIDFIEVCLRGMYAYGIKLKQI